MDPQGNPQWPFNYELFLSFFITKSIKTSLIPSQVDIFLAIYLIFFFIRIGQCLTKHYWLRLKWYGWHLHIPIPKQTYAKSKTCLFLQGPHLLGRQAVKISNNNGGGRREHWFVHSFRFSGWGWAAALWLACGKKCVCWGTCWLWLSLDEGHRSFLVRCRLEVEQ